jgi:hypothetical protein
MPRPFGQQSTSDDHRDAGSVDHLADRLDDLHEHHRLMLTPCESAILDVEGAS